jgi:hypothetical protein
MMYVTPQLDDMYLVEMPWLKGTKESTKRPVMVLDKKDGMVLLMPYSTSYTYYDVNGVKKVRTKDELKQPPYGNRNKVGWLTPDTCVWCKLNKKGQMKVVSEYGYVPTQYSDQVWQYWQQYQQNNPDYTPVTVSL